VREKNLIFIKEKRLDFAKLLKETRLLELDMDWIRNDSGLCSACGNPVEFGSEFCPYCEVEFGCWFDLGCVV